ncbi:MAG TPA: sporulation transcription factor Spo0A [Limnochordia bacterium]|nr:sporulation transcription factor Spo0A [Limnochordia bacterium]
MPSTLRILLADDNREFCRLLRDRLQLEADFEVVAVAHDGAEALELIHMHAIDIVLLDICMPRLDGIGVLESLTDHKARPRVIVFSALGADALISQASALQADYYVVKPFDPEVLIARIRQLGGHPTQPMAERRRAGQVEGEVLRQIAELGVPAHYKGCTYLKEAITLVVDDPSLLERVTKELYPSVAARHHTTSEKVERAIRHAIETTWTRGNLKAIHTLFTYTVDESKGRPTNSSFIATMADRIRLNLRAG